jgi:hypothetical protein
LPKVEAAMKYSALIAPLKFVLEMDSPLVGVLVEASIPASFARNYTYWMLMKGAISAFTLIPSPMI